jgi:hypothetical protein
MSFAEYCLPSCTFLCIIIIEFSKGIMGEKKVLKGYIQAHKLSYVHLIHFSVMKNSYKVIAALTENLLC